MRTGYDPVAMSVQRRPFPRPPRTTRSDQPCVLPEVALSGAGTEDLVSALLCRVGEDLNREGLLHTPQRVARSLEFLTSGYGADLDDVVNGAVFAEDYSEMVLVKDIELYSLCEHHLLPFFGKAHVAYIPDGRLIGLSKLPRLVDVFARRLQVQERLTTEIAEALDAALEPKGVFVVIEAEHLCMTMRGVKKPGSITVTSALRGRFKSDGRTRSEAFSLIRDAR